MVIEGWGVALKYTACAFAIVIAATTPTLIAAAIACCVLIYDSGDR